MIKKHPQPKDIKQGDHVIIAAEEEDYKTLIGLQFLVGNIKKTKDERDYELLLFNGKKVF